MATKVKRSAYSYVSDFAQHGMNYLFKRDQISPLEKERNKEKTWLKDHIMSEGTTDAKGNVNVYFERDGEAHWVPGPGNTQYWGLQQRLVPGAEFMNTDEVIQFAETLHPALRDRVVYEKTTVVVDTEELYVLYQEGVITKKQLRSLIRHEPDSYQLWPITEAPMDDDE